MPRHHHMILYDVKLKWQHHPRVNNMPFTISTLTPRSSCDCTIKTLVFYNRGKTDGLVHTCGAFLGKALGFESRCFAWEKLYLVVNCYKNLAEPGLIPLKFLGKRLLTGCVQPLPIPCNGFWNTLGNSEVPKFWVLPSRLRLTRVWRSFLSMTQPFEYGPASLGMNM